MKSGLLTVVALCLALTAPAVAQKRGGKGPKVSPAVGEEAVELGEMNWVLNAPENDSIAALKGEVILIEFWGTR